MEEKPGSLVITISAVKLSHTTLLTQGLPSAYLALIGGMTSSKLICSTLCIWKVWNCRKMAKWTKFQKGACHKWDLNITVPEFKEWKLFWSVSVMCTGKENMHQKEKNNDILLYSLFLRCEKTQVFCCWWHQGSSHCWLCLPTITQIFINDQKASNSKLLVWTEIKGGHQNGSHVGHWLPVSPLTGTYRKKVSGRVFSAWWMIC